MGRTKELFGEIREQENNGVSSPKQKAIALIDNLPKLVESGELHALDALGFIKHLEGSFKSCKSAIEEYAADAISKGDTQRGGFEFNLRSGATRYSYKNIPEVVKMEIKLKDLKDKYKQMYLAKQKGAVHANVSEDGEILPLPEPSYGKSSIVVTKIK